MALRTGSTPVTECDIMYVSTSDSKNSMLSYLNLVP